MSNINTEAQLFSLFAKSDRMIDKTPYPIRDFCLNMNDEKIICVNQANVSRILSVTKGVNVNSITIPVYGKARGNVEYYGDWIQIIGAACIHDEKHVLMLSLNRNAPNVDGYMKGTLSYPQGHCDFDYEITKHLHGDNLPLDILFRKVRKEVLREVTEEVQITDPVLNRQFGEAIQNRILYPADTTVYPIYINRPGSTERHLCILLDVDMSGTCFTNVIDNIQSNEPDKHSVIVADYDKLLELDRTDTICPWVAKSFSMLHFYQTTFLEDYLERNRKKSAF